MLDISPWLLLFVAAVFIFLIVVLNKMLYQPLLKFMKERDESIEKDLKEAKKNSSNISHLEEEAQRILKEAKAEAHAIREKLVGEVKEEAQKELEAKKALLEKEYINFLEKLEEEKNELSAKLSSSIPSFQDTLKSKLSKI